MAPKHKSSSSSSQPTTPAAVAPSTSANSSKPSTAASSQSYTTSSTKTPTPTRSTFPPSSKSSRSQGSTGKTSQGWQDIVQQMWERYDQDTPQRTRMVDAFMGFLVVVGALQFIYCCLVGTYVSIVSSSSSPSAWRPFQSAPRIAPLPEVLLEERVTTTAQVLTQSHSPSTPSCRASGQQSANSSSQHLSACRPTQPTKRVRGAGVLCKVTNGLLPILSLAA